MASAMTTSAVAAQVGAHPERRAATGWFGPAGSLISVMFWPNQRGNEKGESLHSRTVFDLLKRS
jgi:hypothetical protein